MSFGLDDMEDFYTSHWGLGGVFLDEVYHLTDYYIAENMDNFHAEYLYRVTGRRGTYTNMKEPGSILDRYPYSIKIEGNTVQYGSGFSADTRLPIPASDYPDMEIAIPERIVQTHHENFTAMQKAVEWHPERTLGAVLVFFLGMIELIRVTGRTSTGELRLGPLDQWPSEILLILTGSLGFLFIIFWNQWLGLTLHAESYKGIELPLYTGFLVFLGMMIIILFLTFVRKIKTRRLMADAFLFRLGAGTLRLLRGNVENLAQTERSFVIAVRYVTIAALLLVLRGFHIITTPVLILLELVAAALFLYLLRISLQTSDRSVRASLDEQLKAERLKVDLITNVSHDLNTPLTSIIGYADLLQDEPMSDDAREYVEVLRKKSLRLKSIVSDLFDLSKSTSGAMDVNPTLLDYAVLVRQTIWDLQDTIRSHDREVVVKILDEPVWIEADGLQLYRVLQNLLDNALRYSLAGTRIFLRLEINGDDAYLTLKNTSAYPLDFDQEEILSRFVRGDLSRTTEGSGLGLAIAHSFTENNEGSFQIFAEEDVFMAIQTFRLAEPPPEEGEAKQEPARHGKPTMESPEQGESPAEPVSENTAEFHTEEDI